MKKKKEKYKKAQKKEKKEKNQEKNLCVKDLNEKVDTDLILFAIFLSDFKYW